MPTDIMSHYIELSLVELVAAAAAAAAVFTGLR